MAQWAGLTRVKGAAGPLWRVKHTADIRRAGGGRGRGRGQGRAGGVGGGDSTTLGLAVRDAAVADLARLVLQRRRVPYGAGPGRGGPDARGLEGAGVLLHLKRGSERERRSNRGLSPIKPPGGQEDKTFRTRPYEAGQGAHVAWLDFQRLVEEVVGKVLLRHVLHGVQVLKELLPHTHTHQRERGNERGGFLGEVFKI